MVLDESRWEIVGNIDVHKQLLPTDNKQDNEIDLTEDTNSKQSASGVEFAVNLMANETHLREAFQNDEGTSAERMEICEPPKTTPKVTQTTENHKQPPGLNRTQQHKEVASRDEDMDVYQLPTSLENVETTVTGGGISSNSYKEENNIQLASNDSAEIPEIHGAKKTNNACFDEPPSGQTDKNIEPLIFPNLDSNETKSFDTENATEIDKGIGNFRLHLLAASEQNGHKGNGELESTLPEGFDETGQKSFSKTNTDRNTAVSTVDRTNLRLILLT